MADEIVWACDRYSDETVILRKHVIKYKHMRKSMVEFHSKSESRGIKIDRVDSIRITKLSIYFNYLRAVPLGVVIKRTLFLMSLPVNQYTLVLIEFLVQKYFTRISSHI